MKKTILFISLLLPVFALSVFAQDTGDNNSGLSTNGRVFWRGTVDDVVMIRIQGGNLSAEAVSGKSYGDGTFSFTSPLPDGQVSVGVTKKKGRGTVAVVQQPDASNDFTALVEIRDLKGGAKEYHLEIYW